MFRKKILLSCSGSKIKWTKQGKKQQAAFCFMFLIGSIVNVRNLILLHLLYVTEALCRMSLILDDLMDVCCCILCSFSIIFVIVFIICHRKSESAKVFIWTWLRGYNAVYVQLLFLKDLLYKQQSHLDGIITPKSSYTVQQDAKV
jgi:hypothetical protein